MQHNWESFLAQRFYHPELDFSLDYSLMGADAAFLERMRPAFRKAVSDMHALEGGAIANPDEQRMVGHYWLRDPQRAPNPEIEQAITACLRRLEEFATKVHRGEIAGTHGPFAQLLVIGIGGSALGPQFVAEALGEPGEDRLAVHFFDNTDPDGIDRALSPLRGNLGQTLVLVVSKSGGTPETRNGMLEARQAFLAEGADFAAHAVAVTGEGSKLDQLAESEGWLARFPMWDWVGGRTSELAAVGLLPAALQGIAVRELLEGAAAMDALTRGDVLEANPAGLLAVLWYHATNGRGEKDMVILPYKDRLQLFSKYLQQLIMESLGKEFDLEGKAAHQGIAVYGNKGSTDQHAYVQQLREGVANFFVTFIEVKKDREGASIEVEDGITTGDYLQAFLLGTRSALAEKNRPSLALTIDEVTPHTVGMLIALYERAVGFYASLVNINAYHQPGVEAGKKAAAAFLTLQSELLDYLASHRGSFYTAPDLAAALGKPDQAVAVLKLLEHALGNPAKEVQRRLNPDHPSLSTYGISS